MTITAQIAAVLNTSEANLNARLIGLHIAPVCNRCGGSGSYSFNQIDGSRCYGCNGKGHVAPKARDMADMLEAAEAAVADGRFAAYMLFLESMKISKNAASKVMAAWEGTGISKAYDWTRCANGTPRANDGYVNPKFSQRDKDISDINKKMYDAYVAVETAARKINSTSATYHADIIALAELVTASLAAIAAADVEFKEYIVTH